MEGPKNKFIGEVYRVPMPMEVLYNIESGGWHIVAERMSLKEWLRMVWNPSTWQVCFCRSACINEEWPVSESHDARSPDPYRRRAC